MTPLRARCEDLLARGYGYEDIAVEVEQPWQLVRHLLRSHYVKHQRASDGGSSRTTAQAAPVPRVRDGSG